MGRLLAIDPGVASGAYVVGEIDRVEVLEPGDTIYFESDISHSFRCLSEQPARAVVVLWTALG